MDFSAGWKQHTQDRAPTQLLLENKAWLVYGQECYGKKIGLQPSLLQFCTFMGCGRLWFSAALTRFSYSGRVKNHYYRSSEDKNNLQGVKAPPYLLLRVVILFVWSFQTIFFRLHQCKIVFYDETHCKWMMGLGGIWKKEESNYIWKQKL